MAMFCVSVTVTIYSAAHQGHGLHGDRKLRGQEARNFFWPLRIVGNLFAMLVLHSQAACHSTRLTRFQTRNSS
ncbi:hypothetical protein BDW74DRAFT_158091 [Aspergillus multicolor]|uniref:uncharacterized protein n=1 Tax=Aspergillus multicolor TaxID=41759 RepID=UPI003CCDEBEA